MKISKSDLFWIAGLLEGEGSFGRKSPKGTERNICISCHMTDKDVLEKLLKIAGVGYLNGPYSNGKSSNKPRFMWRCHGEKAYVLMKKLLPLMGIRRAIRIKQLITLYESYEPKIFKILNVDSGKTEETTNIGEWLKKHSILDSSLYRTMTGDRASCHGWKRLQ